MTIALSMQLVFIIIAVSIYCYLIKYQVKQKYLLPYYVTNEKFTIEVKMSNTLEDMDIKNHAYYFFDNIINITNFDPNKIKIDEKSKIFLFTTLDMRRSKI